MNESELIKAMASLLGELSVTPDDVVRWHQGTGYTRDDRELFARIRHAADAIIHDIDIEIDEENDK